MKAFDWVSAACWQTRTQPRETLRPGVGLPEDGACVEKSSPSRSFWPRASMGERRSRSSHLTKAATGPGTLPERPRARHVPGGRHPPGSPEFWNAAKRIAQDPRHRTWEFRRIHSRIAADCRSWHWSAWERLGRHTPLSPPTDFIPHHAEGSARHSKPYEEVVLPPLDHSLVGLHPLRLEQALLGPIVDPTLQIAFPTQRP